jgi:hypothetical protein
VFLRAFICTFLAGVLIGICGPGTPMARGSAVDALAMPGAWALEGQLQRLELMVASQFCFSVQVAKEQSNRDGTVGRVRSPYKWGARSSHTLHDARVFILGLSRL